MKCSPSTTVLEIMSGRLAPKMGLVTKNSRQQFCCCCWLYLWVCFSCTALWEQIVHKTEYPCFNCPRFQLFHQRLYQQFCLASLVDLYHIARLPVGACTELNSSIAFVFDKAKIFFVRCVITMCIIPVIAQPCFMAIAAKQPTWELVSYDPCVIRGAQSPILGALL